MWPPSAVSGQGNTGQGKARGFLGQSESPEGKQMGFLVGTDAEKQLHMKTSPTDSALLWPRAQVILGLDFN